MKDRFIFIAAALEIIGQVIKDFGVETFATEQPIMPWREIAGMRNVLAHEYLGADPVMVWETVQTHLDTLKQTLKAIMEEPNDR
ncbi:MAG: HepT-like ribonuclease domain-containing protein [Methylococcaceae bacterium]|jgi:uncharacterized protein with HEPN domain